MPRTPSSQDIGRLGNSVSGFILALMQNLQRQKEQEAYQGIYDQSQGTTPARSFDLPLRGGGSGQVSTVPLPTGQPDMEKLIPLLLRNIQNPLARQDLATRKAYTPEYKSVNTTDDLYKIGLGQEPKLVRSGQAKPLPGWQDAIDSQGNPVTTIQNDIKFKKQFRVNPSGQTEYNFVKLADVGAQNQRRAQFEAIQNRIKGHEKNTDFKFWNAKKVELEKYRAELGRQVVAYRESGQDELAQDVEQSILETDSTYEFINAKARETAGGVKTLKADGRSGKVKQLLKSRNLDDSDTAVQTFLKNNPNF